MWYFVLVLVIPFCFCISFKCLQTGVASQMPGVPTEFQPAVELENPPSHSHWPQAVWVQPVPQGLQKELWSQVGSVSTTQFEPNTVDIIQASQLWLIAGGTSWPTQCARTQPKTSYPPPPRQGSPPTTPQATLSLKTKTRRRTTSTLTSPAWATTQSCPSKSDCSLKLQSKISNRTNSWVQTWGQPARMPSLQNTRSLRALPHTTNNNATMCPQQWSRNRSSVSQNICTWTRPTPCTPSPTRHRRYTVAFPLMKSWKGRAFQNKFRHFKDLYVWQHKFRLKLSIITWLLSSYTAYLGNIVWIRRSCVVITKMSHLKESFMWKMCFTLANALLRLKRAKIVSHLYWEGHQILRQRARAYKYNISQIVIIWENFFDMNHFPCHFDK